MYPSDYGYATSGGSTTDRKTCLNTSLGCWSNYSECYNNDWLSNGYNQWALLPSASSYVASNAFFLLESAYVMDAGAYYNFGVRPVVYLKSNVKISSGTGSQDDPFTLEL